VNKDGHKAYDITDANGRAEFGKQSFATTEGSVTVDVSHTDYGDKQIKVVVL